MSTFLSKYEKFVSKTTTVRSDAYPGLGLAGEAGEVYDEVYLLRKACAANEALKKIVRNKETPSYGTVDTTNLKSELGDVMWYLTKIALMNGLTVRDIVEFNIEKLEDRRKNGKKVG